MKIILENLNKDFNEVKAVNNLNIEIKDGELVSLLGPSGCGKSTTLFLIAGLHKPTSGNIYFDDELMNNIEPEDRGIGMVFQNYALYPHMSVLKNIMFPLKMQKINKKESEKLAIEMAELTKIEDLLDRKPSQLSGGQQQRVAIARALVKKPKLLLLDEPLSNLDARLRIEMREEIKRIQKEVKITTVFVTHDQEEAMSISDKILLMKDGIYQQYDTPKNMYTNPKNKFVAEFLGNPPINFIEGRFNKDTKVIRLGNTGLTIDGKDEEIDKEILSIGIRPEDLIITDKEKANFEITIKSLQTMGKEIYVMGDIGENKDIVLVTSWDHNLVVGEKVPIHIRKFHVF
ncbi:ABC transporter ATP-binding protein [Tissierella sp. MSJ-40]|uniref:ABC transporter ATP-binding protein n=1 Tax=Tissierella simiarum TaxID=2841534 RepID=A0ABS6E7B5_9FIRM|nr:ABC transporter ATP-binding protein [Tissierella simiarum]MBU5438815.1 ABC transporter ATP-binding protein [Tissierella simiarum]